MFCACTISSIIAISQGQVGIDYLIAGLDLRLPCAYLTVTLLVEIKLIGLGISLRAQLGAAVVLGLLEARAAALLAKGLIP